MTLARLNFEKAKDVRVVTVALPKRGEAVHAVVVLHEGQSSTA